MRINRFFKYPLDDYDIQFPSMMSVIAINSMHLGHHGQMTGIINI